MRQERILLAENRTDLAARLQNALKSKNYQCTVAQSRQQAVSLLSGGAFELVVLSFGLLSTEHGSLLKHIREHYPESELPVLVILPEIIDRELEKILESGATCVLTMPFADLSFVYRVRSMLQLQESNAKLKAINRQRNDIFQFSPVASMVLDKAGGIIEINHAARELFHVKPATNINVLCGEIFRCHHAIQNKTRCGRLSVCKQCVVRKLLDDSFEWRTNILRREGKFLFNLRGTVQEHVLLLSATFLQNDGLERVLMTIDDVTKERNATRTIANQNEELRQMTEHLAKTNDKLRQSEERYRRIIETTEQGFWLISIETKTLAINPALENMLGYRRDEMIGKSPLEFADAKNQEIFRSQMQKIRHTRHRKYEIELLSKQGEKIPAIFSDTTLTNDHDKPIGAFALITDLRFKIHAERQIKTLSTAVTQSPAAIMITDLDGNIEYVNPQFSRISGYSYQEVNGKNPRFLRSEYHPESYYKTLWETIISGKIWRGEFYNRHKNGGYFWESTTIAPITGENGKINKFVAVKQDITEQKQAQKALQESEKELREANVTKDKFLSIISHDLKSPFNLLLGFSELLLKNHKKYPLEKRERMISNLYKTTQNTYKLLENLLTWARSQSGRIEFAPQKLDLGVSAKSIVAQFEETAQNKEIALSSQIQNECFVWADKNMLHTILRNLVSNAIKFTHKGGKVCLSAEKISNELLKIGVQDTGVGIAPEKINELFRIDKNFSATGTAQERGTGLGLMICKEFIEKHQGKIDVQSQPGKGSVFYFTMPLAGKSQVF